MTDHQKILDAWEAAGKPEIPHRMPGVDVHNLERYLVYLERFDRENKDAELARIWRHLGLDA